MRRWFSGGHLQNVAFGKPYTLGAQWPDRLFAQTERDQYPDRGQLTGAAAASPSVQDPAWLAFLRQHGRSIVVDLGDVRAVESASLSFLHNPSAGILLPGSVRFYGSSDRLHWLPLGVALDRPEWYEESARIQAYAIHVDVPVSARYIRAQFAARIYAFASEFIVLGRPAGRTRPPGTQEPKTDVTNIMGDDYLIEPADISPAGDGIRHAPFPARARGSVETAPPSRATQAPPARSGFLTKADPRSGGIHHMQLVYTGSRDERGTWSTDEFIAMLTPGPPGTKDCSDTRLFDAALFCPYGKMPVSAADWSGWLDDLFAQGVQLAAMNAAAAHLQSHADDPGSRPRLPVVIAIPGTLASPNNFGILPGHGGQLSFSARDVGMESAAQNKWTAIDWFMRTALEKWNSVSFSHLRLAGFYWQPETVHDQDPFDRWLIRQTSDAVHAAGMLLYWIPFYGASGITEAEQLGFDAVMVQPGASFHPDLEPDERLRATAAIAAYYGYGLEIELHWDIENPVKAPETLARYQAYFAAANRYGFGGDVCKAYYLGSKSLLMCSRYTDPAARQAYADTVQFVRG